MILESPTLPVEEGDQVTLRCSHKGRYDVWSTSDFNAAFYRDGVFIGNRPEGKMILQSVSKDDQGSYKCQHPTAGESPQSLLVVTGDALEARTSPHWLDHKRLEPLL